MPNVVTLPAASWGAMPSPDMQASTVAALEAGDVLFLPALAFAVEPREVNLFTPALLGSSKNSSFDPASGRLSGTTATGADAELLRGFIQRFIAAAAELIERLRVPLPGSGQLLALLRVTKTRRSPYDALMLQLHDRMKEDDEFQRTSVQTAIDFPAGSTWLAFTDAVSHAAMSGQYQLEQTFLVPVTAMLDDRGSPLRVLERLTGRRLV